MNWFVFESVTGVPFSSTPSSGQVTADSRGVLLTRAKFSSVRFRSYLLFHECVCVLVLIFELNTYAGAWMKIEREMKVQKMNVYVSVSAWKICGVLLNDVNFRCFLPHVAMEKLPLRNVLLTCSI